MEEGVVVVDRVAKATFLFGADESAIRIVEVLIQHAYTSRASDIHIDPQRSGSIVRQRVDGFLAETHCIPARIHTEVIARIKILAGLRTDDHQSAHDGRFDTEIHGAAIDVRVSIVPTYHGENCVLRLLSDAAQDFTLARLGCTHIQRETIATALRSSHGMILTTGPTGSGKTTTLYTMLKMLNKPDISIVSIEEPIEYAIAGITQIPIGCGTNLTFASGLRSVIRQDPDVIMVGEIRDSETARLATNAALTGHLVVSTVHTNDAATTLPRLLDMDVAAYLVASTVRLVIGQRLVRRICTKCKAPHKITRAEKDTLASLIPHDTVRLGSSCFRGRGCPECSGTGYLGRVVLMETLPVDSAIREALMRHASAAELHTLAVTAGMRPLIVDGCQKMQEGVTTFDEVLRVLYV